MTKYINSPFTFQINHSSFAHIVFGQKLQLYTDEEQMLTPTMHLEIKHTQQIT